MRLLGFVWLLSACAGGGLMTGGLVAPSDPATAAARSTTPATSSASTGVELRAFGAQKDLSPAWPNAYGVTVRQVGDEHVQRSVQAGWMVVHDGPVMVYGRLMFDLLSWEKRMDGDDTLSAFSPTLDLGVAPWGKGVCFSASATYDVHFGEPDRWLAGLFVGVCAGHIK